MLASANFSNADNSFLAPCFPQKTSPGAVEISSTSSRLGICSCENHNQVAPREHSRHVSLLRSRRALIAADVSGANPAASKSVVATKKYCVKIAGSGSNATTRPGNDSSSEANVSLKHSKQSETSGRTGSLLFALFPRRYNVSGKTAAIQLIFSSKWMHSGAAPFSRAHQLRLRGKI